MDMIKFFCNGVLFKMNIPLLHPYSEADKRRDALLEKKSKNAFKTDDSDNYSAVDMPNQDDDEILREEAENADIQREHAENHTEPTPSGKVAKHSKEGTTDEDEEEEEQHHETTEEENEEGEKTVTEEHTKTDEDGGEHKETHEHTDKGDEVEHKVTKEHTDEDGEQVSKEVHTGTDQKATPAPASPAL